ncbi:hypothetical protein [Nonomuraea aridisoli]|uniref:hypothetical protein n=1 Tax=Nonomuraea aridisoli TaxID=2070368 RepID=UPI0011B9491D|nr:hypothetical protein [Nonomuraea aridisoli]
MTNKRSFLLAALLVGSLLGVSPATAQDSSAQRSPDPFKAALLAPEDLGEKFARHRFRTRGLRNPAFTHTKPCATAVKDLVPVYRTKVSTALKHTDRWEGISEYIVSGTSRVLSALERAAKAVIRHCGKTTIKTSGAKVIIRKLSIGQLGDGAYGIRFRDGLVNSKLESDASMSGMMVAIDIVIIRVGNAVIALEHDGHVDEFDPTLTETAARLAVARLREAAQGG